MFWNIQAFGGIVIGFVTKYAGGVRKGFALIAGNYTIYAMLCVYIT